MKIGLIGKGAIARYVLDALEDREHEVVAILLRPERVTPEAALEVGSVNDFPAGIDTMIECAGHTALSSYGPQILAQGIDMITVSLGALADRQVAQALDHAATQGRSKPHLASSAIGALDCLAAAVALAKLGFDGTQGRLIADPTVQHNIHEVTVQGDFGSFSFQISGNSLPDNPRSSALAAMSVVAKLDQITARITL